MPNKLFCQTLVRICLKREFFSRAFGDQLPQTTVQDPLEIKKCGLNVGASGIGFSNGGGVSIYINLFINFNIQH